MPAISVILCAHNPRCDYLDRTLEGLRRQRFRNFELVVVDNASSPPLAGTLDLAWNPDTRIVVEPELGLTRARLRGIAEARADTLVFVDDDNVLAEDYLEAVDSIARENPHLGAWGGSIVPEFEIEPAQEVRDMLPGLALRDVAREIWSNYSADTLPYGAGLCVRSGVAQAYAEMVGRNPERLGLGRTGGQFLACEDLDLSMTAWDQGLATGLFPALQLLHLIPKNRLDPDYLHRICAGAAYSHRLLEYMRSGTFRPAPKPGIMGRIVSAFWWRWRAPAAKRLHRTAMWSGFKAAEIEIMRREQAKNTRP